MAADDDPIADALDQLRAHGLIVDQLDTSGIKQVVAATGHRSGAPKAKKGWYVAHLHTFDDGKQAVFGVYGNSYTDGDGAQKFKAHKRLSDDERRVLRERTEALRKDFEVNRAELAGLAKQRAAKIWPGLSDVGSSPYLDRKRVRSFGCKFAKGHTLVVPVRRFDELVGLQFIDIEGAKKFLTGTAKQGAFHLIGSVSPDVPLVFAEGYATAASIHMATRWPVVVCFDAGNLWHVVRAWRAELPESDLVIAADNDHETKGNPGVSKARKAAKEFACRVVVPQFEQAAGLTDFNDLHVEQDLAAVQMQMDTAALLPVEDRHPEKNEPTAAPHAPAEGADAPPDPPPPDDGPLSHAREPDGPDWRQQLSFDNKHQLKPMVHNVRVVLQHHEAFAGLFGFDEFAQRVVKLRATPWASPVGAVGDVDEIEVAAWFGRPDTYGIAIHTGAGREAMLAVAQQRSFHPVRDYLNAARAGWDGVERLPTFFADFCEVENNAVHTAFGLNFFISAAARIFHPGVKADLMLVIEGPQGLKKSTLFNALGGDDWFLDLGASPADKDFFQLIQGRWIVEISELAAFAKADTSHIKRAVSARIDSFRPAYGRNPIHPKRQCVFVGTVNNSTWHRDESGGRRFMPIWVEHVNFEAIRDLRDQLWGEAAARYLRGEKFWELPKEASDVQEDRYEEDTGWAKPIVRWLDGKAGPDDYASGRPNRIDSTDVNEVLSRALGLEWKKQDKASQTRAGIILQRLGWIKKQVRDGRLRMSKYSRPEEQKK